MRCLSRGTTTATGYMLKFVIALALTPVIYLGRWIMETRYGLVPLPVEHRPPGTC